ncbi:thiol:disulfide interchange protein DsbA/DsbL [Legionella dresdenensis]|uniref:Thiol:disulfide interchange protein n=1 Tax=Legionella dresdenensis TaxID=450200 RepID=A0ABV8CD44_9GAMM
MLKRFLAIALLIPTLVFADEFVAGKDYELIGSAPAAESKVSVTEFFSYGCPWCLRIEPALNQWVKKHEGQINFSRVPVAFNKSWAYYAKAYYAANLLGLGAKLDPKLFKAIQTDKQDLANNQAMVDFFVAQGVDKETAESAFNNSTIVDLKVNEGNAMMGRYQISGVPAVVISNRYKTDLRMAQSEERFIRILDYLVNKAGA